MDVSLLLMSISIELSGVQEKESTGAKHHCSALEEQFKKKEQQLPLPFIPSKILITAFSLVEI